MYARGKLPGKLSTFVEMYSPLGSLHFTPPEHPIMPTLQPITHLDNIWVIADDLLKSPSEKLSVF